MPEPAPERPLTIDLTAARRAPVTALPRPVADRAGPDDFDAFYRRALPDMVRVATLVVGSRATAEDLVQDAFVRVHARWSAHVQYTHDPGVGQGLPTPGLFAELVLVDEEWRVTRLSVCRLIAFSGGTCPPLPDG